MNALLWLIATTIFQHGHSDEDIPLAPYDLKLHCRSGQSHILETQILSLCPSSSTSCGYFEFEALSSPGNAEEPLAIYECIDSSILMSDNDDNEEHKQMLFSKYCDDQARCREITLPAFNAKFIQYLAKRERVRLQRFFAMRIKFCCAINDPLLQKIIHSGDYVLPTLAPSEPVFCNNVRCRGAPVGCLTYLRYNKTEQSEEEDVIIVQPVHIDFEDHTSVNNKYLMKNSAEHHCVYRHFNNELYRYCLLLHDQPSNEHCFYGDGYQICCCFLHRDAQTCDPLSAEIMENTSTETPEIVQNTSTMPTQIYGMDTGTKLRTSSSN